jgi:hypothetical protein
MLNNKEWLQLSCHYACNAICHACKARVPDYLVAPSKLDVEFRHSTASFLAECVKGGDLRSLLVKFAVGPSS